MKQDNAYSKLIDIRAEVPQGSVLGSILYLLYISNFPKLKYQTITTIIKDTAVIAVGKICKKAAKDL